MTVVSRTGGQAGGSVRHCVKMSWLTGRPMMKWQWSDGVLMVRWQTDSCREYFTAMLSCSWKPRPCCSKRHVVVTWCHTARSADVTSHTAVSYNIVCLYIVTERGSDVSKEVETSLMNSHEGEWIETHVADIAWHVRTIRRTCRQSTVVSISGKLVSDSHIRRRPLLHTTATDVKFSNFYSRASLRLCTCRQSVSARQLYLGVEDVCNGSSLSVQLHYTFLVA